MTIEELTVSFKARKAFGLTAQQWSIFTLFVFREQVTNAILYERLWPDPDEEPLDSMGVLYTQISRIRRRIKPFKIELKLVWGTGYFLSKDDRMKALEIATKAMER